MNKEDFLNSLTKEQKDFVEFLCDEAWCRGYTEGNMDGKITESYK